MKIAAEIGAKIKKLRYHMGLNQKDLAEIMEVDQAQISKWEGGKSLISTDHLVALCKRLRISADFFFNGVSYKVPKDIEKRISEAIVVAEEIKQYTVS